MCCCGKPVVNGEPGYSWDGKSFGIRPVNPPDINDAEALLYDEPGRCGGLDSHCHHYRVVQSVGRLWLLVRHGAGDQRIMLSGPIKDALASLDSNNLYWLLNALYHAQSAAARRAQQAELLRWQTAAAQKRIKVRKIRGTDHAKVTIEPAV
jgi:hypothetical protein